MPSTNITDTTIRLTKTENEKMNQAFNDTRNIITKYTNNVKLREQRD